MLTMNRLREETAEFFKRHWWLDSGLQPPQWTKKPYEFSGEVEYGMMQGCYALLEGNEVAYIGLGAKEGSGLYQRHGINARLKSYSRWDRTSPSTLRIRIPSKTWISSIHTIGFPAESSYLACALEIFLLRRLSPRRNKNLVGLQGGNQL